MAFIPTPDCARASLVFISNQQQCVNTLWFRHLNPAPTEGELTVLADTLLSWYTAHYKPIVCQQAFLREITVTGQWADNAPSYTLPVGLPAGAGGDGGEPLPNNATMAVSFRTVARGRSGRGRNYAVGLTRTSSIGNAMSPSYVSNLQAAYQALMNASEAEGWMWVVVSHFHNKQPRTEGLDQQIVAVVVVDAYVDSQRRRLTGRGK